MVYLYQFFSRGDFGKMLGTIVNTCTIVAGSCVGAVLRRGIRPQYRDCLYNAMGLAAVGLGANAVVGNMGKSEYPVLFIVALALGSLAGTVLDIDGRFQNLVGRFSSDGLGKGLGTGILMFCIGTLSILGPINSALYGDHTYLFTNATLDFVTSMVLASTYGVGIAAAAGVLFVWQGSIYLFAGAIAPYLTDSLMAEISLIGGFLIAASGLSILGIKDCKSMNMLPALLVPAVFFVVRAAL